jgi:excisionase family DNA binding protein
MSSQFLTISEAAQRLGITSDAVHKRIARGGLDAYRKPRSRELFLLASDVEALDTPQLVARGSVEAS